MLCCGGSPPQVEAEEHQDVVVYDQSTRDVSGLAADSFLSILLGKLDSCFHSVSILTGRIWLGCHGEVGALPLNGDREDVSLEYEWL